ncbi:MAG: energy transducer TonB [Paracoccaceae bacterium]|nr:energy transducer TonB [Paracoccaceae bacterium]
MRLGWTLSFVGHSALILFILFGGLFRGDRVPEPMTVSDVTVISEAEFAALVLPGAEPEAQTDAPEVSEPATEETAPEAPAEDAPPNLPETPDVEVPEAPEVPDITTPDPVPNAVIVDDTPPVPAPPSELDGTSLEADAVAAPAPRVAAVPQVAPPPDVESAPDVVPDTAPEPTPEPEIQPEPEDAAAPEAASDRIVTEAEEEKTYAPASSMRPRARPTRPVRRAETPAAPEPSDTQPRTDDAVADALREAETEAPVRSGPPLTGGEKDGLRVAVSRCWNVGSLSTEALGTTVVVAVEMEQSGKPITGSIRMVDFSGGSEAGARQAYEAARRAIIRCGARGFPLPVEKFDQWREIEMTFNPEGMQFR